MNCYFVPYQCFHILKINQIWQVTDPVEFTNFSNLFIKKDIFDRRSFLVFVIFKIFLLVLWQRNLCFKSVSLWGK